MVLVAPIAAERARVPGIIGLILAGTLVGPNGLGLLDRQGPIELLGSAGLLYLMFVGGLDLDLDGLRRRPRDSLVYGGLTTVVPMVVNTGVCLALGFDLAAALLLASAFTSHTLVAYPLVQRFGLTRNRAVTATLGATLLCTVAALLVLAVIAALAGGDAGDGSGGVGWPYLRLAGGLVLLLAAVLVGLPRLTRWFFAGLGQDRAVRFTFVLVAMFGSAALAQAVGIEAIVGAFLAGLALNPFLTEGSKVTERVQFLGSTLLIPIFLISTGMLIDPVGLAQNPRALGVGAALTVAALAAKWLSVLPTGRLLGFDRAERGVVFALSAGQAAGALAAAIVAADLGVIDQDTVNAVVLVILGTCMVAPAVAARTAPRVPRPERKVARLGHTVVVPIANPASTEPLVRIAAMLAARDNGKVLPVTILGFDAPQEHIDMQREVVGSAERVALANGAEAHSLVRVDNSPVEGILHTVVEGGGTSLLIGWKGFANRRETFFGSYIDSIVAAAPVPVFVCRPGTDDKVHRVVLSVTPGDLTLAGLPGLELAAEAARRLAKHADVPLVVITERADPMIDVLVAGARRVDVVVDERKPSIALRARTEEGDLVLLGTPPTRAGLGQNAARVARGVPDRTVMAVVPRVLAG